jgi:hypothetical protein
VNIRVSGSAAEIAVALEILNLTSLVRVEQISDQPLFPNPDHKRVLVSARLMSQISHSDSDNVPWEA